MWQRAAHVSRTKKMSAVACSANFRHACQEEGTNICLFKVRVHVRRPEATTAMNISVLSIHGSHDYCPKTVPMVNSWGGNDVVASFRVSGLHQCHKSRRFLWNVFIEKQRRIHLSFCPTCAVLGHAKLHEVTLLCRSKYTLSALVSTGHTNDSQHTQKIQHMMMLVNGGK